MSGDPVYIHYGSTSFDTALFKPVQNCLYKPKPDDGTGLWACRVDEPLSWKWWCQENKVSLFDESQSFRFRLRPGAKVLRLEKEEQLQNLPRAKSIVDMVDFPLDLGTWVMLDYEILAQEGYDAIEMVDHRAFITTLPLWDCNCLFVMNPEIIVPTGEH